MTSLWLDFVLQMNSWYFRIAREMFFLRSNLFTDRKNGSSLKNSDTSSTEDWFSRMSPTHGYNTSSDSGLRLLKALLAVFLVKLEFTKILSANPMENSSMVSKTAR
ncbi:hypothetical protein OGAPHI_001459 [Ogataea philodendri]|uniref:Uncharacterized protein n=1 Tax=Ogataea philodendri TaxID=1378263 RepID=A0A9P8PBR3_9ASCO|nr:uncharacterized protein OGAPHI_001459 [Ogataea philodendri]KAH3669338.1 hypothetical protein OGAPHI_001459 [Ogataea philodendri]